MIVGIVGYREFNDYELFCTKVHQFEQQYGKITKIISGGCRGTDKLAKIYSQTHNIELKEYCVSKEDWNSLGKKAGPLRNQKIVNDSEIVIAFLSQNSKGTVDTITRTKKANKPLVIIEI